MSSISLHSYLKTLALEADTDCENLKLVMDNARIPFPEESSTSEDSMAAFSRSLSAINTVSFPPPFLNEASRWDASMEGSSSSDFELHVPSRTRDEDETDTRRHPVEPHPSLDSTAEWLRQLPMASDRSDSITASPKIDSCPLSPCRVDDDLPPLNPCPYEEVELHPVLALQNMSDSTREFFLNELDLGVELSSSDTEPDSSITPNVPLKEEPQDEKLSPVSSRWSNLAPYKPVSVEKTTDYPKRIVRCNVSPRTLIDFPYANSIISSQSRRTNLSDLDVVIEQ